MRLSFRHIALLAVSLTCFEVYAMDSGPIPKENGKKKEISQETFGKIPATLEMLKIIREKVKEMKANDPNFNEDRWHHFVFDHTYNGVPYTVAVDPGWVAFEIENMDDDKLIKTFIDPEKKLEWILGDGVTNCRTI